jgi:HEAT repeat protein
MSFLRNKSITRIDKLKSKGNFSKLFYLTRDAKNPKNKLHGMEGLIEIALANDDYDLIDNTVSLIGSIALSGSQDAMELLIRILKKEFDSMTEYPQTYADHLRSGAESALEQIGDKAEKPLISLLDNTNDDEVLKVGIRILGVIGRTSSIGPILKYAVKNNIHVKKKADSSIWQECLVALMNIRVENEARFDKVRDDCKSKEEKSILDMIEGQIRGSRAMQS